MVARGASACVCVSVCCHLELSAAGRTVSFREVFEGGEVDVIGRGCVDDLVVEHALVACTLRCVGNGIRALDAIVGVWRMVSCLFKL